MLSYFHLDLNDRRQEKKEGEGDLRYLAGCTQEGGGGVIQMCTVCNRGGGSKNGGKMRM